MNATPLVSVLMTSYNREKYIAEAIESVLASTLEDFELIITDDCSKDGTVEIAKGYAARDQRVKVHVNEKNLGDYPNRNKAASYAVGEYLKYVDADDYIYPWGLDLLVSMMGKYPDAGWGLCSLDQYVGRPFPFQLTPREAYEYSYLGPGLFHKAPLSSIIRRKVFEEAGGFSAQRMSGDYEMWHRLALRYPVLLMPQGIVWYREHGDQEIKSFFQYIETYDRISLQYLTLPDCPLDKQVVAKILRKNKRDRTLELLKATIKLRPGEIKSIWARLQLYYAQ
ncbi:MAG TPA: glycosyltransferase family 2 protein [Puia sp.]|nr:glycosyltransferase family 2 protein [Puia sp.]